MDGPSGPKSRAGGVPPVMPNQFLQGMIVVRGEAVLSS